jgi:hypothetical protein
MEKDTANCRIFNNLKSLKIGEWDMINDIDLVACFLKNSPNLGELTLHLRKVISLSLSLIVSHLSCF